MSGRGLGGRQMGQKVHVWEMADDLVLQSMALTQERCQRRLGGQPKALRGKVLNARVRSLYLMQ